MKKTNLFLLVFIMFFLIFPTFSIITHAAASPEPKRVIQADIIEWRYKIVDGKLYRRQYNTTKQEWIGEWELCP